MPIRLRCARISRSGRGLAALFGFSRKPIRSSPIQIAPSSGGESQFRQRSSVDFPEPDGLSTQTVSPRATVRSTPSRMRFAPNDLTMPRAFNATGGVLSDGFMLITGAGRPDGRGRDGAPNDESKSG